MKNYESEVKTKIAEQSRLYFEAWQNKDLESTLSFLADDFINMFSINTTQNKEQCRDDWKNIFDNYAIEDVEYKRIECIVHHDMAFDTGWFKQKWTSNDKKENISFNMRGLSIYKKQSDGSWKMFRLIAQQ